METLEMEKIQHGNSRTEKMKTNDRKFVNKEKITQQMYKKKKKYIWGCFLEQNAVHGENVEKL